MSSKEALEELLVMATLCLNKGSVQRLAVIKKDLEVLEILKNYIDFINCHYTDGYYNEKGQTYIDLLIPESDKNYAIIKEWLKK